jgi:DNA-binding transcriptional regulator YdaS (Cro superfamily)
METLILYFGSPRLTAAALGVQPSYISMCRNGKRRLGLDKILLAIELTNGLVTIQELRAPVEKNRPELCNS